MNETIWSIKKFKELTTLELHDIIQLREQVFILEQNCPYLDVDGKDKEAYHVFAYKGDTCVATSRILVSTQKKKVAIGRICTNEHFRKQSLGKLLVNKSISYCKEQLEANLIKISAQTYLIKFYEGFGFSIVGQEYLEDNIPHIGMVIDNQ